MTRGDWVVVEHLEKFPWCSIWQGTIGIVQDVKENRRDPHYSSGRVILAIPFGRPDECTGEVHWPKECLELLCSAETINE